MSVIVSAGAVGLSNHVTKMVNDYPMAQFRVLCESGVFFPEFSTEIDATHQKDIKKIMTVMEQAWKSDQIEDCLTCHEPDKIWTKANAQYQNPNNVKWAFVESAFDPTHYWYNRAMRVLSKEAPIDGESFFKSKVKFFDQLIEQAKAHPQTFYGFVHHQQGHVLGRGMCSMNIPPSTGQMWYKDWWRKFITDELDEDNAFQLAFFQMDDPTKQATIKELMKDWEFKDFWQGANDNPRYNNFNFTKLK